MGPVRVSVERPKRSVLQELLELLRKLLRRLVELVTCSHCCRQAAPEEEVCLGQRFKDSHLSDNERASVESLLTYLETVKEGELVMTADHVEAMAVLTYSENADLQKSAALCYLEFSERMSGPLTEGMAGPLVELVRGPDLELQQIASLAVGNFATRGHDSNKETLVRAGAVAALVQLLKASANSEVLCNACGCVAALSIARCMKGRMVEERGIAPLLAHLVSRDRRVQKNAAGAIVNLTQSEENRVELARCGAVGALTLQLSAPDSDVVHFSVAALSNLALEAHSRHLMLQSRDHALPRALLRLLLSRDDKIICQACLALRNLASDKESQGLLVSLGVLPPLHGVVKSCRGEVLAAAVGCLRNLSIHPDNELPILVETFLREMCRVLREGDNVEAMRHAAGVIRNLAAGDHVQRVAHSDCLREVVRCLKHRDIPTSVLAEVTAALAIFASDDDVRVRLLTEDDGATFTRLVTLTSLSSDPTVQYNCAGIIGEMVAKGIPEHLLEPNRAGIVLYIDRFLKSTNPSFVHLALWTLNELLCDPSFLEAFREQHIEHVVGGFLTGDCSVEVTELAGAAHRALLEAEFSEEDVFASNDHSRDDLQGYDLPGDDLHDDDLQGKDENAS